jgi:hypothetical protein
MLMQEVKTESIFKVAKVDQNKHNYVLFQIYHKSCQIDNDYIMKYWETSWKTKSNL